MGAITSEHAGVEKCVESYGHITLAATSNVHSDGPSRWQRESGLVVNLATALGNAVSLNAAKQ